MKFLHSMIRVNDIDKSLKFYEEILNMSLKKTKRLDDCTLYYLEDEEGTAQIELTYNDEKQTYELGNGFGHFAFSVNSMDEFNSKLKKFGIDYLYEPFVLDATGTKIAFIKDPDGYEIELIEKEIKF